MRALTFCGALAAALISLTLLPVVRSADDQPTYKDAKLGVEQRVADLLGRMTLEEKLDMLAGATWMESRPNQRLGIPAIRMADGPAGVKPSRFASPGTDLRNGTAFPVGVALAATWDVDLVRKVGRALGLDAKALGRDMVLGPTVNIHRVPQGGRNFESFGEDPYLTSRMAVAYIRGLQGEGVMASVKHFAVNNQETDRFDIDVKVDDRTMREIYLPAFHAAVTEAGAWTVMSAYNKFNGAWCAENRRLLTAILKDEWRFQGFVVSDWISTHSTIETANAGLDIEMPGSEPRRMLFRLMPSLIEKGAHQDAFLNREELMAAIDAGTVQRDWIDDKVRRLLRVMFTAGLFERREPVGLVPDGPEQRAVARAAATESIVLLKNVNGLLPLSGKVRSIAVIGPNGDVARTGGGGSSEMKPKAAVSPVDAIRQRAGAGVRVEFARGCSLPAPGSVVPARPPKKESPDDPATRAKLLAEASALAAKSDVAIVFAGYSAGQESEGFDRDLQLPAGQDELIEAVVKANKNTIVVLNAGAAALLNRWIDRVPAVVNAWYLGEEGSPALAAVLFGDANPSGRLPTTFIRQAEDAVAYNRFPGAAYDEGIYVGYRHFDKLAKEPLFAFGYGLSYTTFAYRNLRVTPGIVGAGQPVTVSLDVRNTGGRAGAEVVQLYMRDVVSSIDRPVKEMKAFQRLELKPGQTGTASFTLDKSSMAFYDPGKKEWIAEPGVFEVWIGASSRDIRLKGSFELKQ